MEKDHFFSKLEIKSPPLSLSLDTSYGGFNSLPRFFGVAPNQSKVFINESADILIDKILSSTDILSDDHRGILSLSINIIRQDVIYNECRKKSPNNKTLIVSIRYFDLFHTKNNP